MIFSSSPPGRMLDQPLRRPLRRESLSLSLQFSDAALCAPAMITVRIVGLSEGRALNRDYRGQDHATNVLTFDYERTPRIAADLVLCAPVIEREAAALGLAPQAHYAHLPVHGALHAQRSDHVEAADANRMEALERRVLRSLGLHDPYPG